LYHGAEAFFIATAAMVLVANVSISYGQKSAVLAYTFVHMIGLLIHILISPGEDLNVATESAMPTS